MAISESQTSETTSKTETAHATKSSGIQSSGIQSSGIQSSGIQLWPGLIIVLLGSQIVLMLVMAYLATSDRSFAVEPNYYQKALHWDDLAAEQQASSQLGWHATIAVSEQADIYKCRDLACTLTDKAGDMIEEAVIEIVAFSHSRGSERVAMTLTPAASGQYRSRLRISRPGLWEFRIAAQRGDDKFTQVQEIVIASTGDRR